MCAGVVAGTLLGVPVLARIPAPVYRRVLGALLVGLGALLLATSFAKVVTHG